MGWADAAYQLATSSLSHVKFVLPNAPIAPVTLNGGMPMPSWYDITSLDNRANQPCDGLDASVATVNALIAEELENGIPLERIVVGGFSQGGAVSLFAGLSYPGRLAGIVCMSGYLPRDHDFALDKVGKTTPVGHFHGIDDPTVRIEWATQSQEKLKALGVVSYELSQYPGLGHGLSPEEFADVEAWVLERLPPTP